MHKTILTESFILHDLVKMPKNFEINRQILKEGIVYSSLLSKQKAPLNTYYLPRPRYKVPFSRALDMLNIYIIEHIFLKHKIKIFNLDIWGNSIFPNEQLDLSKDVDPMDLRNSPDFVMIYGVNINDPKATITFHFDNKRAKDREYVLPLRNNQFIFFPSHLLYKINKNKSDDLNVLLTITYNYAS